MNDRKHPYLWLEPEEDPRTTDGQPHGERETLTEYLGHYRMTLELKCQGLDNEQLARRSVPPSKLSLLGLVRHMASVEHYWFQNVMSGSTEPQPFRSPDVRDVDFDGAVPDQAVVDEAWEVWRREVSIAEDVLANASSLDALGRMRDGTEIELREVLVHMIEEYARHCGHADLIREVIDGRTGL